MAITLGPWIGHTTTSSVKIAMRGEEGPRHDRGHFCYGAVDVLDMNGDPVQSMYCHLKDYYDFTGHVVIEGLDPGTSYRVRCDTVFHEDDTAPPVQQPVPGPVASDKKARTGRFRTAPDPDQQTGLRFVLGSCRYLFWDVGLFHSDAAKGDKAFKSIRALHDQDAIDFTLMVGDQCYADPLNVVKRASTREEFYARYRKTFDQPHFQDLLSRVPNYMVLDDHEIRNDWSKDKLDDGEGLDGVFEAAMNAYFSYQHLKNPSTPRGQYWYTFDHGRFPFFVMDTRTQRIVKPQYGQQKTILGREQLNALLEWLHQNRRAPMKFLATSVPFFPDTKKGTDKWAEFELERSTVLEFLRVERIRNVVFLSGDVHNTSFSSMGCHQDRNFRTTSLVASPFYWPYPHSSGSDFFQSRTIEYMEWSDKARRTRDRIEYRYEGVGFVPDESFAVVEIDLDEKGRAKGTAKAFGRKGAPHPDFPSAYGF